ncbi:hypothetical protein NON00_15710 [Roseomonas sp. GC11]|uniref:hypothetical protein n=1 Tax=Roseomonas sp. GC11 TaxID=2950546 RepID=UPI00210B3100|nr:hypothetical protein [Roseomonas sp. GC11]MCQ4161366.1 hypothetical protein [Roseomonas sp. GC11]
MPRALSIEDDRGIGEALAAALAAAGSATGWLATQAGAEAALACGRFDGLVPDRALPDGDAVEPLRHGHRAGPHGTMRAKGHAGGHAGAGATMPPGLAHASACHTGPSHTGAPPPAPPATARPERRA